jgi:hypothetical protein
MMKSLLVLVVMLAIPAVADFDCDVTCPTGYKGGCVKSESGCHCSCNKQATKVKEDLLKGLRDQGASGKVRDQATRLFQSETSFKTTTLNDEQANKKFTIFIKDF